MKPVVSVIIPAYNAESVLPATLQSLHSQTFRQFEAILVDDGSTDNTGAVANRFSQGDPRLKVLRQQNRGVASARNAAIAAASGDWVAFLDADDVWFPTKLENQLAAARRAPEANFIFSNYWVWDGSRDVELRYSRPEKMPSNISSRLVFFNLFGMSSVMLRWDLLSKAGPFDNDLAPAEDWDMWLRVAEGGFHPVGVSEPLLRYRVWPGNASRNSLTIARKNVQVLTKAVHRSQDRSRRRLYERSLKIARSKFELAAIRPIIDSEPKKAADGIFNAWQHSPTEAKWLLWYLGMKCPGWLGGRRWSSIVSEKIKARW